LRQFSRGYSVFFATVVAGRPEKKMPPWGEYLSPEDIQRIGAYLETLAIAGATGRTRGGGVLSIYGAILLVSIAVGAAGAAEPQVLKEGSWLCSTPEAYDQAVAAERTSQGKDLTALKGQGVLTNYLMIIHAATRGMTARKVWLSCSYRVAMRRTCVRFFKNRSTFSRHFERCFS